MDIDGFRDFLSSRKIDKKVIESSIATLKDFESFLQRNGKDIENVTRKDFYGYSNYLIKSGKNTLDNYISILRYGYFKKIQELIIAGMEVLDGREVIKNFSDRLMNEFSKDLRDRIFDGVEIPALGISQEEKPRYMQKLVARLEENVGVEKCAQFLNKGLRDRYEEARKPDREKFLKSKNLDLFLKEQHRDLVAELETHLREGTLFFTQEITKEVVEHVRNNPYIEGGFRQGDKIIIEKIPHMAKEYLAEKDEHKKRYYYCHCPWVKEAFKESEKPLSPVFCNCSAGFYRAYWEIVFGEDVRVDVLESLLKGDSICKFAVHVPAKYITSAV